MKRATFFSLVVFALVASYVLFGALTQLLQGALEWKAAGFVIGMALGLGILFAGIFYLLFNFVCGLISAALVKDERYIPSRAVILACAAVVVLTTAYSVRMFYTEGAAELAAKHAQADTYRRVFDAELARLAALTPEQREAELKQQRDKAEAAAAARDAESAKKKQRDAQLEFAALGAAQLKNGVKDPDTFELKSAVVSPTGTACYEFRATNSFGAKLRGQALLTSKGKFLLAERDGGKFVRVWNSDCTMGGDDIAPWLSMTGALNR
jgi:hypothetical protein